MPDDGARTAFAEPVVEMGEFMPYGGGPLLAAVALEPPVVRLVWSDGAEGRFHPIWLRDSCACADCRHPVTRERTFSLLDLPADLPWPEAEVTPAGALRLLWPAMGGLEAHESLFDPGWLRARCYAGAATATRRREVVPWGAGFRDRLPVHSHPEVMESDEGLTHWLMSISESGFALTRGGPARPGEVERLAGRVGPLRETNFGRVFDVRAKPRPNNAAYTAMRLEPHADLVNWRRPPDYQLLYCLENGARGGDSLFADGFAVAEALKAEDPAAFAVLTATPVDFRFQDEEADISARAPVIGLGPESEIVEIRFNNWLRDSLAVPEETVEPFYRAYAAFWRLARDPRFLISLRLAPGECVTFDNLRVLHGRAAFEPGSGARHLQGCYLDRDTVASRLAVLRRAIPSLSSS